MATAAAELQRSSGTVRLSFKARGGRTVLGTLYQQGCHKARFPRQPAARACEAILINTAGGLTDGDTLATTAVWQPGTDALLTTQAAERVYASRQAPAAVTTALAVGADASACWLPQETILFDGGRMERRTDIDLAADCRLYAADSLVFGRAAMGEVLRSGAVFDRLRIRIDGRLVFADTVAFDDARDGELCTRLSRAPVANGAGAMATLVYAGPEGPQLLPALRARLEATATTAGASQLGPLVVARLLAADAYALRAALAAVFDLVRDLDGFGARARFTLPRVWRC